jgi:glycosyltransferase involved in cell wall biosynthesis
MRSLRCGPCFFQFLYSMVVIIGDCCSERHRSRHPELGQQWRDLLAEIGFIGPVDFGGDLQGNAQRPRYSDGAVRSLFGAILGSSYERSKTEFLGEAQALLFPTDWLEPFGLAMIEAMACGTPVLAFRRGNHRPGCHRRLDA